MANPRENSRKPAARAKTRPPIEPAPDIAEEDHADLLDDPVPKRGYQTLPLVGLGGSAGSIPALQTFFSAMPADSGMAFVVVLHLSPEHESSLADLIGRWTSMPVEQVHRKAKVGANRIYVIPPGKSLTSADGHLELADLQQDRGKRVAVDLFFRTMADTHGPRSTAIVLSGADGDGAIGIKRIKERGGLTIAQDPDEAVHSSMPRAAIDTGMVDWVLEVAEMPKRLVKYYSQESKLKLPREDGPQPAQAPPRVGDDGEAALRDVLMYLRTRTGHDFANYKRATIVRRIARRMQVNNVDEMPEYLAFLRTHAGEAGALLQDLLISVTNFFRDRDAFEALQTHIRDLFRDKRQSDTVRVWVPGCATGEEAYSLAMLLVEYARNLEAPPQIQVFATDLDGDVVRTAREAVYPETITADVSDERLRRFFVKEHRGYRVRRELRELVLFAVHDLLKDSPFSRLDLISCRNLLIYFDRHAQQRAFETFNFALQPRGILFLGLSESADEASELFSVLDKRNRIYAHRPTAHIGLPIPVGQSTLTKALQAKEKMEERPVAAAAARAQQNALGALTTSVSDQQAGAWSRVHFKLLERFGPPSIVIDQQHRIVHLSHTAGRYLQLSGGEPSTDLLHAAHPMLRLELRSAIYRAKQSNQPASVFNVPIELDGARQAVDIEVSPVSEIAPDFMLVTFSTHPAPSASLAQPAASDEVASHLVRENEQMRATLRDTVEQHEASSEELKASNEELQAMNEELRSATEELETSREELQSINEELTTVNQELRSMVDELGRTNADLHNLMAATDIATVFLDRELVIMRYTPAAVALFNLIPTDVGRPLANLKPQLDYPELFADAERVLERLVPVEREVLSDGRWFLARVNPYRTLDDRVAGVVLALVDITDGKRAEIKWRESEEKYRTLFDSIDEGFCIIEMLFDQKGAPVDYRFLDVNPSFTKQTGLPDALGKTIRELAPEHEQYWFDIYGGVALTGKPVRFENLAGALDRWYDVYAFRTGEPHEKKVAVLFSDITARKRGDARAQAASGRDSFRMALTDALRPLTDPIDIQTVSARLIGQHLRVNRANYVEVDGEYAVVRDDYIDGVAPLAGRHRMADYYGAGLAAQLAAGRTIVVADAESAGLSKGERAEYAAASIRARITVPLVKAGKLAALLSVQQAAPREWTTDEIALVEETAERTWVAAERARVEAALATSDERLRLIFESAQDYAIMSLDLDRRITSWNVGAERLLGYAEAEAIGQCADMIFTSEDRAAGAPEREEETAIKTGRASDERWHLRKDGSRFWGSGVMMAMRDPAGAVIGLVKIFRDETQAREIRHALEQSRMELVQALQEKERARADLESANQAKDQFLAVLSHELRTPLTPVVMAVHTLTRRPDLPEPMRAALEMIRRNVKRESRLIDDLLDLTRITRGKIEIVPEPVNLHEAITAAVEVCEPDIQNKNQKLTVALEASRYRTSGDFNRLQQVVWNLLKNASKFTGVGGEIRLSTSNKDNFFKLVVEDTGMGIDASVMPTIFDAFTQGGAWVMREYGGLGLGLAISKATIEAHGGCIKAESEGRGQGATFTVELPLKNI